jgi:hypothetical protein
MNHVIYILVKGTLTPLHLLKVAKLDKSILLRC